MSLGPQLLDTVQWFNGLVGGEIILGIIILKILRVGSEVPKLRAPKLKINPQKKKNFSPLCPVPGKWSWFGTRRVWDAQNLGWTPQSPPGRCMLLLLSKSDIIFVLFSHPGEELLSGMASAKFWLGDSFAQEAIEKDGNVHIASASGGKKTSSRGLYFQMLSLHLILFHFLLLPSFNTCRSCTQTLSSSSRLPTPLPRNGFAS